MAGLRTNSSYAGVTALIRPCGCWFEKGSRPHRLRRIRARRLHFPQQGNLKNR